MYSLLMNKFENLQTGEFQIATQNVERRGEQYLKVECERGFPKRLAIGEWLQVGLRVEQRFEFLPAVLPQR